MNLQKMKTSKTYFLTPDLEQINYCLTVNRRLKIANLGRYANREIDLVYSDNIEDIDMQLLFYGFKIVKDSKQEFGGYSFYDIRPI